jgi:hypothetical protein
MSSYPFNTDYFNDMTTEPQVLTFKEFNDLIKVMSNNNSRTTSGTHQASQTPPPQPQTQPQTPQSQTPAQSIYHNYNHNHNHPAQSLPPPPPLLHKQHQTPFSFARSSSPKYAVLSDMEAAILRSSSPIHINSTEEITVNGERGIWANKNEELNWRGELPITDYLINQDHNPEVIKKNLKRQFEYVQELAIRYLKPPTPPQPGEIIIKLEASHQPPPAPPLIIRQQPPRPMSPAPLVIREEPPKPPATPGRKLIKISGKKLPPPPRKVVIERLAPLPQKPQSVIIERWLPYPQENLKRRVIFQRAPPDPITMKPKNVIIQWEAPNVIVKKNLKYLGTIKADPIEYMNRYSGTLRPADQLPQFVKDIKTPDGLVLASDWIVQQRQQRSNSNCLVHELVGDVEALKLVDLDREGLSEYKTQLEKYMLDNASPNTTTSMNNSNNNGAPPSSGSVSGSFGTNSGSSNTNNNSNGSPATIFHQATTPTNNYKSSDEEAEKIISRLNSRLRDSNGRRLIADPSFYYMP